MTDRPKESEVIDASTIYYPEGEIFAVGNMSKEVMEKMRAMLEEHGITASLREKGNAQDAAHAIIADKLPSFFQGYPKDAVDAVTNGLGDINVVPQSDPLFQLTQEVVNGYNQQFPERNVAMLQFIVRNETKDANMPRIGTLYYPALDVMLINEHEERNLS